MSLANLSKGKGKSLKLNIVFNALYQVLILIIPFITSPYISRVLLPTGVGNYSYAYSWISYFIPIADYGFLEYGTVRIAKKRKDRKDYSQFFWQLFACKRAFAFIVTGIYLALCLSGVFLSGEYSSNTKLVFAIRSRDILAYAFDITFLFQGLEKFVSLCVRNLFVKLLNLVLIFTCVRTSGDYLNYVIVISSGLFLSGFSTLRTIPFSVDKPRFRKFNPFVHFKEAFVYFIPYFVSAVYYVVPKTRIGLLAKDSAVSGYYESADKLVNIVLTVVCSLSTIRRSRRVYLYETKNEKEIKRKRNQVRELYALVALPCFFGLLAVNKYFTVGFFGQDYSDAVLLVYIRAAKILFNPVAKILGSIYYVPAGHAWKRSFLLLSGLAVDVVFCAIGTYLFGVAGTCVASRLSECVSALLFIFFCRKEVSLKGFGNDFRKCFDSGLIRALILYAAGNVLYSIFHQPTSSAKRILITLILMILGRIIYGTLILLFKEKLAIERLALMKNKLKKRKDKKGETL